MAVAHAVRARLLDAVRWEEGCDLMASLAGLDVAIVDCRDTPERVGDRARQAAQWADMRGSTLIVLTDLAGLDAAFAAITGSRTLLLCDPSDGELIVALRIALDSRSPSPVVRDGVNESDQLRLERLFEEFSRLSSMLEALLGGASSDSYPVSPRSFQPLSDRRMTFQARAAEGSLTASQVRALLRARRLRDQLLPGDLFADPAWDILLDLTAARLERQRVSVSSLCIASAVPPTTALRWIRQLTDRGLLERQDDDMDGRRVFISLTPAGYQAVERWFAEARGLLQEAAG